MRVVLDLTPAEAEALAVYVGQSDSLSEEERLDLLGNATDLAAFTRAKRKVEEAAGWIQPKSHGKRRGPHLVPIDPSRLAGS